MRTLLDIIEAVKDDKETTEREMRLAICALDALLHFDFKALAELYKAEKEGKKKVLLGSALFQYEEAFRRHKAAMSKSPEEWLGPNHLPENPDNQRFRRVAFKLLDKVTKAMGDKDA